MCAAHTCGTTVVVSIQIPGVNSSTQVCTQVQVVYRVLQLHKLYVSTDKIYIIILEVYFISGGYMTYRVLRTSNFT